MIILNASLSAVSKSDNLPVQTYAFENKTY